MPWSSATVVCSGAIQLSTEQVNTAIQQLDKVTQQNASASEEMSATSEQLAAQAEQLQASIGYFRIGHAEQPDLKPAVRTRTTGRKITHRSPHQLGTDKSGGHSTKGLVLDMKSDDADEEGEFIRY